METLDIAGMGAWSVRTNPMGENTNEGRVLGQRVVEQTHTVQHTTEAHG